MATYNDYYRAGYKAALKDLSESDEADLIAGELEKRQIDESYIENLNEASDIIEAFDRLSSDTKKVALTILNNNPPVQFLIKEQSGFSANGMEIPATEILWDGKTLQFRIDRKDEWQDTMDDGIVAAINWLGRAKAKYLRPDWPR